MKNITARKIVLFSIGLLSAIMLLIGLSFSMYYFDFGTEAEEILGSSISLSNDGFDMLSFRFSKLLRPEIIVIAQDTEWVELYETFFGITSLLTLIMSILFIGLIVLAFFKFQNKKGESFIIDCFVIAIIISVAHAVFPILFSAEMNSSIEKLVETEEYGYSAYSNISVHTSAFVPLIFQVILLIGYIVCSKMIKNSEPLGKKNVGEKTVIVKENAQKPQVQVEEVLTFEYSVIELLKEYKKLHDEDIITAAEYMEKRVKIMNSANEKEKRLSTIMAKASFEDIVKAEQTVVQVLREYKKLCETGIISDADYIAKKVVLLRCIIN